MIKMLDSVETLKYTLEYFDPMNNMNNYKDVYNIHSEGAIIYTRYMDKGSEEKKGEASKETIHTLLKRFSPSSIRRIRMRFLSMIMRRKSS